MIEQVFSPGWGAQTVVTNATSATAAVDLPVTCREIALTNTSETADVFVFVTPYEGATVPAGVVPTAANGFPVLARQQVRIGVGLGRKVIRTIASTADGSIYITPGNGG
jgi:hypothetical protein